MEKLPSQKMVTFFYDNSQLAVAMVVNQNRTLLLANYNQFVYKSLLMIIIRHEGQMVIKSVNDGPGNIGSVDMTDYSIFASWWQDFCPNGWQLK